MNRKLKTVRTSVCGVRKRYSARVARLLEGHSVRSLSSLWFFVFLGYNIKVTGEFASELSPPAPHANESGDADKWA